VEVADAGGRHLSEFDVVAITKSYPGHARKTMSCPLVAGASDVTNGGSRVDQERESSGFARGGWKALRGLDPRRDIHISLAPWIMGHALGRQDIRVRKMGIDATGSGLTKGTPRADGRRKSNGFGQQNGA